MTTPLASCAIPSDWTTHFSQCLYEWQGLEAGALALVAAMIGAKYLWKQISQSEEFHEQEIESRHNAARIALPLALSSLSEICQTMSDEIASRYESYDEGSFKADESGMQIRIVPAPFEAVEIPDTLMPAFTRFVETLRDADEIRHVGELTASLQILMARWRSFNPLQAAISLTLQSLHVDVAKVAFLNDCLFNYARFSDYSSFSAMSKSHRDIWTKIKEKSGSLLFFRDRPEDMLKKISDRIDRYIENDVSPWNEKFEA